MQKESIKSELRNENYDQTNFEFKSAWNQILNCQNHVQVGLLERRDRYEDLDAGFI